MTVASLGFSIRRVRNDEDLVIVKEYPEDPGQAYEVIQTGFWWWRRFCVAFFIPDTAALSHGGSWRHCSTKFKLREEAQAALYTGDFEPYWGGGRL